MRRIKWTGVVFALCLLLSSSAAAQALPIDLSGGAVPREDGFIAENVYEDSTIRVQIEEHQVENTRVVVARVRIEDPSQLRTAPAYSFQRPQTEMTKKIARRVNAVAAINGDYFSYSGRGYMIRQGQLYINKPYGDRDVLLIDADGDFYIEKNATEETLAAYADKQIVNSFNFGPGLVIDGEVTSGYKESFNAGDVRHARSCIAQVKRGELEYLLISCESTREKRGGGMTVDEFAAFVHGLGVENAYNLDGGNSTSLIFGGNKMNAVRNKDERSVSDIIYFASAEQAQ